MNVTYQICYSLTETIFEQNLQVITWYVGLYVFLRFC